MGRLFERFKLHARGKKEKKKATAVTPAGEEDRANSTEAQPEPASLRDRDGIGPLVVVNNIRDTGTGASGTDIVFVHGLRGTRVTSWSKNGIYWPEHLLGKDLTDVRVITWGYDATIANAFHAASKESIFGHADPLLDDLARLRVGITRPIVFVCHGLGGLVVKEALIKADNYNNHQRHRTLGDMFAKTTGVIFMGTPHRGSSQETYGDLLVKVAKVALRQPNDQLLQTLRPDSHILENQRGQFTTISSSISVVCIREELPTSIGVIVPETSASYDGFNVRRGAINANHMDMVKFASDKEPGYQRTLGFIAELCHARNAAQQDATGQYLTAPQGNEITARPRCKWIGMFLDDHWGNPRGPISLLEVMATIGCHQYVLHKIKEKGLLPPELQKLLQTTSKSLPIIWRRFNYGSKTAPRPEVIELLFAAGVNPNSKLDDSDNPSSEPSKMDRPDESVRPPKGQGLTAWTSLLQGIYCGKPEFDHRNLDIFVVIQQYLENGADRMARFHGQGMALLGVEDVIERLMKDNKLSIEDLDSDVFPDIVALLQSKADKTGRLLKPPLDD
ncbi:hypothetical protein B0I37DRAFT_374407 [Chaetomium sp. MPI-CAGE-AT-0009]|nr:hypothetical protein B0I37DRAFT_374407 [Chaetomium sp. MPI-CAGE-AT-0009]